MIFAMCLMFLRKRLSRKVSRQGSALKEDLVREKQPPRGTEEGDRLIEDEEAAEGAVSITGWVRVASITWVGRGEYHMGGVGAVSIT